MLVSGVKWTSYTYTYIYPFLDSFPNRQLQSMSRVFFLYSRYSLVIYFIYNSIYIINFNLQMYLPFPPLVTISLFSTSVTLFLFCKQAHLYHFLYCTYKQYHIIFVFLSNLLYRELNTYKTFSFSPFLHSYPPSFLSSFIFFGGDTLTYIK